MTQCQHNYTAFIVAEVILLQTNALKAFFIHTFDPGLYMNYSVT